MITKWWSSLLLILVSIPLGLCFRCDRKPYGSTTQSSPPDGRFQLVVKDAEETYIPDQLYTVKITETDGASVFTLFMISAEGDLKPDPRNPRRLLPTSPGEIRPQSLTTARYSDRCLYSVEQSNTIPKSSVEVYWQAPPSDSGCITIRAMVAENSDVWYEDGTPLTVKLCEDTRQPDDVSPQLNYECNLCDEAKYEISFTGIWSRNTHPVMYPENDWIPKFSDLVGASHAADYIIWAPGTLASDGLKDLAEYANSSKYEQEIREKVSDGVRTLIKSKGHGYPKLSNPSYAHFRTDKVNHLVTVAIGIYPSPDWFLGISRYELCLADKWLEQRELNLYPWDAGTDSGVSYESQNIPTFPQDAVSRIQNSYDKNSPFYELDLKEFHPFGKLEIKLVKTYHKECETTTVAEGDENKGEPTEPSQTEPEEPSRYHYQNEIPGDYGREPPVAVDPDTSDECPMSQWQEWSQCEGDCEDGKVVGYRSRERYHLVNGLPAKYDPNSRQKSKIKVSDYCKNNFETLEIEPCEEECNIEENLSSQRRVMTDVSPGHGWSAKRRDILHTTTEQENPN